MKNNVVSAEAAGFTSPRSNAYDESIIIGWIHRFIDLGRRDKEAAKNLLLTIDPKLVSRCSIFAFTKDFDVDDDRFEEFFNAFANSLEPVFLVRFLDRIGWTVRKFTGQIIDTFMAPSTEDELLIAISEAQNPRVIAAFTELCRKSYGKPFSNEDYRSVSFCEPLYATDTDSNTY